MSGMSSTVTLYYGRIWFDNYIRDTMTFAMFNQNSQTNLVLMFWSPSRGKPETRIGIGEKYYAVS